MGDERTLFERILNPEKKPSGIAAERDALTRSIHQHLKFILNSRQGCCSIQSDFGMPEIMNRHEAKNVLARELAAGIRSTIARYEPRLTRIQVRLDDDGETRLLPRFTITAQVNSRSDVQQDISFTTVVDPVGKISVY